MSFVAMDTYSHVSPNIQKEAFGRLGKRSEGLESGLQALIAVSLRSNGDQGQEKRINLKSKSPQFAGLSVARSAGLEPATF